MRALSIITIGLLAACAHSSPPPAAPPAHVATAEENAAWEKGLRAFLGEQKRALQGCYDQEVHRVEDQAASGAFLTGHVKPPNLTGKTVLVIPIEQDGAVHAPRLEQDSLQNPRVGDCLLTHAKSWHISPPPDGLPVEVEIPFAFAVKGPAGG